MVSMTRGKHSYLMLGLVPADLTHTHDDGVTHAHVSRTPARGAFPQGRPARPRQTSEVSMNTPRPSLIAGSVLVVPLALVVGAGPVAAAEPPTTFGSHVSSCAMHVGFSGAHNPSHHRGPTATHDMSGMCGMHA